YYAHAGAGELHLRPILDLKKSEDVKLFRAISEASAKLVTKYGGSLSGEHGDGRVRSEFIAINLGETIYNLFKRIKTSWDPQNIFNPQIIVDQVPMDECLRYETDIDPPEFDTMFDFSETGGILRTVEKCNGSGDCRKLNFAGGTMCPSYRATLDEKDTTRGRANVLREFLTQNTKSNPFNHPEIAQAMELCISCKGCKSECPSNIDMATLKAEFQYQYNKSHKIPLRTKLVAHNARLNALASKFSAIHNVLIKQNWFKSLLGIAKQRALPSLANQTFRQWFKTYTQDNLTKEVYLFCDENTNYYDVEIGIKTVKLLNALGYKVVLLKHRESARTYLSKGFLDEAKRIAEENVTLFKDCISEKTPLIGLEPSTILTFRDEYINLVNTELKNAAKELASHVFVFDEFLSQEIQKGNIDSSLFEEKKKNILLHGHCHQKALSSTQFSKKILSLPKNYKVEEIPSGCCGMAGAFGYEKEHYILSQRIGNMVLFPAINKSENTTIIATSGTSCKHQIEDGTQRKAIHPIEILYDAIKK
ncbi:MAG: 4Fe-4S dicluster domain-containing protein, partial [Bacteroidia bacterium]|nr:4Fe-4S dicluster domain-containing protein [Bacteroidia bacterium]